MNSLCPTSNSTALKILAGAVLLPKFLEKDIYSRKDVHHNFHQVCFINACKLISFHLKAVLHGLECSCVLLKVQENVNLRERKKVDWRKKTETVLLGLIRCVLQPSDKLRFHWYESKVSTVRSDITSKLIMLNLLSLFHWLCFRGLHKNELAWHKNFFIIWYLVVSEIFLNPVLNLVL